jgi:hypothetical protein
MFRDIPKVFQVVDQAGDLLTILSPVEPDGRFDQPP